MKRMHKSSNPCNNGKSTRRNNGSGKVRDISSKNVLENPVLCAQFLRDNVKVPLFKDVRPEDIEDVSERYRPYLGTEFESDDQRYAGSNIEYHSYCDGKSVHEGGNE